MNSLDARLASFLRGVREAREPNPDATRRVRAQLRKRLPPGAFSEGEILRVPSRRPGQSPRRAARAAGLLGALAPLGAAAKLGGAKLVVGALIVTGGATGATWVISEQVAQPDRFEVAKPPVVPVEPGKPSRVAPVPTPQSVAAPSVSAVEPLAASPEVVEGKPMASSAEPEPRASTLGEEVLLLRRAEAARRSGDAAACLASLSEMARRFPGSSLTEERLTLTVLAHCDLGQTAQAVAVAERLRRAYPGTVHEQRLSSSCARSTARFDDR